jgi:OOP family OmpA-OmpF porin
MNKSIKRWQVAGAMIALMMLFAGVSAEAQCVPKVDNFLVLVDQSGSMYMDHKDAKAVKMLVAKQILTDMNASIPDLRLVGGLVLFAPFQSLVAPAAYNRSAFEAAIKTIKNRQDIYGRETPMAEGILSTEEEAVLSGYRGKTAVILLTDGKSNVGGDPVQAAKEAGIRHPNAVFYVISFAQPGARGRDWGPRGDAKEKAGAEINRQISTIGNGMFVEAMSLYKNPAAMKRFVNDVFCGIPAPVVEQKIVLRGIQFDVDKSDIKPEYQPLLDEAVSSLKSKPDVRVVINGHTDNTGAAQYNMALSERRAEAVLDYFTSKGVSASRLRAVGHGLEDPVASNKTQDGRALNRRVELQVQQ